MTQNKLRVEPIDDRHSAWKEVLASVFRAGRRPSLMICEKGWLSSRQTVLAAFDGPTVVGHLCFRIEPKRSTQGQTIVQSRLDSFAVEEGYTELASGQLLETAEHHARLMKCPAPRFESVAG